MRRTPLRARRRKPDYDSSAWNLALGPGLDPHHIIYAQTLRHHGLHAYLADLRNRLPIPRVAHLNHHSGTKPITREQLPACAFEFADEVGLRWWLEKHYAESVAA